ncbi:hypothetical protein [Streptomyces sp. NPDC002402]
MVNSTQPTAFWQSPTFMALIHEAGIASHSLCVGLTTLRKANFMQPESYYGGFFGYTIGLERAMKLTILLDCLAEQGKFPSDQQLKNAYGHDLNKLLAAVQDIRSRIDQNDLKWQLPHPEIIGDAVTFLAEFAKFTRYYNLDILSGKSPTLDPVARWFRDVGQPLLDKRPSRQTRRNSEDAGAMQRLIGDIMITRAVAEDGTPVTSAEESLVAARNSEYVAKEGTFLCTALARYVIEVLRHREHAARSANHMIPSFGDFFYLFNNRDALLKNRKSFMVR